VAAMAQALEKLAGKATADLIDWVPNAAIANIVTSWPSVIDAARARALGLLPDPDFESIVSDYMRENPR
jgi:D-erythronate 2-dehydrogenase